MIAKILGCRNGSYISCFKVFRACFIALDPVHTGSQSFSLACPNTYKWRRLFSSLKECLSQPTTSALGKKGIHYCVIHMRCYSLVPVPSPIHRRQGCHQQRHLHMAEERSLRNQSRYAWSKERHGHRHTPMLDTGQGTKSYPIGIVPEDAVREFAPRKETSSNNTNLSSPYF